MHAQIIKGNQIYDLFVPAEWSAFWLFSGLGLVLLLIAAHFAGVGIGSFPRNPFRWHYWVVANSKLSPLLDESRDSPRMYRPYMFLWAASICSFLAALLVLITLLSAD